MPVLFAEHRTGAGPFREAFRRVVFAVLDRTADRSTIGPFEQYFGSAGEADPGSSALNAHRGG